MTKPSTAKKYLTVISVAEAAKRLSCSPGHVYNLIAAGEIRAVQISTPGAKRPKTRVFPDEVDAFIDRHTSRATKSA